MTAALNADGNLASTPDAIVTFTNRWVRPLDPEGSEFVIEDIAHALSNQCRFTGHTREFYSVAEHCVHCIDLVPRELRLTALMHDASEAYLSDIARPLKHAPGLGDVYREAEGRLETVLAATFGLVYPFPEEIRVADNTMLAAEIHGLLPPNLAEIWPAPDLDVPRIRCWTPRRARAEFLRWYTWLTTTEDA